MSVQILQPPRGYPITQHVAEWLENQSVVAVDNHLSLNKWNFCILSFLSSPSGMTVDTEAGQPTVSAESICISAAQCAERRCMLSVRVSEWCATLPCGQYRCMMCN